VITGLALSVVDRDYLFSAVCVRELISVMVLCVLGIDYWFSMFVSGQCLIVSCCVYWGSDYWFGNGCGGVVISGLVLCVLGK